MARQDSRSQAFKRSNSPAQIAACTAATILPSAPSIPSARRHEPADAVDAAPGSARRAALPRRSPPRRPARAAGPRSRRRANAARRASARACVTSASGNPSHSPVRNSPPRSGSKVLAKSTITFKTCLVSKKWGSPYPYGPPIATHLARHGQRAVPRRRIRTDYLRPETGDRATTSPLPRAGQRHHALSTVLARPRRAIGPQSATSRPRLDSGRRGPLTRHDRTPASIPANPGRLTTELRKRGAHRRLAGARQGVRARRPWKNIRCPSWTRPPRVRDWIRRVRERRTDRTLRRLPGCSRSAFGESLTAEPVRSTTAE